MKAHSGRRSMRIRNAGLVLAGLALVLSASAQAAELVQVSKSVWRVKGDRRGAAVASVIVTDDGLAVVDSTCRSEGDAKWLKAELAKKYDAPVKYVILSHDHEDHICALQVFDDTATTISHRLTREHIVREGRNTSVPDLVFDKEMSIYLGGTEIQLLYFGPTHSDNLIQVYVPDDKVLIAPDFMQSGKGLIPDFRDIDVDNMLRVWNYYNRMYDIDVIVNGHGDPSPKEHILNNIKFVTTLRQQVLDGMVAGQSLDEMRQTITLPEFKGWRGHPQWLDGDIVTMWDYLYRKREPNLGAAHDAWQSVVAKVVDGAAATHVEETDAQE
ncbi:MAG: MBL fold metallo-hydrolase [Amphiplicatus sp.]